MTSKEDLSFGNQFSFSSSPLYRMEGSSESERNHDQFDYFGSSKGGKFPWWPEEDGEEEEEKDVQHHVKNKDHKQHCFDHYYVSRAEEIAKHRREMLDMVKDLPEFGYELTLKDMVELPAKVEKESSREREEWMDNYSNEKEKEKEKEKKRNKKKKKKNVKSGEFLLKMFLPLNLGGKNSLGAPGYSSKVSPRSVGIGTVDKVVDDDNEDHENRYLNVFIVLTYVYIYVCMIFYFIVKSLLFYMKIFFFSSC